MLQKGIFQSIMLILLHILLLEDAMKKMVLLPKTDTVTLCLPEEWIGIPIVCKLTPISNTHVNFDEVELEAEKVIAFLNKKRKKKNK